MSHATDETPIARALKDLIETHFPGISTFVSNDIEDLTPGEPWLEVLRRELEGAKIVLSVCSPTSLTRPWLNFEAGCSWIRRIPTIPICHSGQRKDQLPFPMRDLGALQFEDSTFVEQLFRAIGVYLRHKKPPPFDDHSTRQRLDRAKAAIQSSDTVPIIINRPLERTKLIIDDLKTLLGSARLAKETVWSSAFLSTLAIGTDDFYRSKDPDLFKLLLEEKRLLIELANQGCRIRCIISPANENHFRQTRLDFAIGRTQELLSFLDDTGAHSEQIEWVVSELGTKNLYIVGDISCFEGFQTDDSGGYQLTLRQTSQDAVEANVRFLEALFKQLRAHTWTVYGDEKDAGEEPERLRVAAKRCLERSLDFLLSKDTP